MGLYGMERLAPSMRPQAQVETMVSLIDEAIRAHKSLHGPQLNEKLTNIARRMETAGHVSRYSWINSVTVFFDGEWYDLSKRSTRH